MNIVIIGHVCIDKNKVENSSYESAGSPSMFMNRVFQQLPDTSITIVSNYGRDFLRYLNNVSIYPKKEKFDRTLIYQNITLGNGKRIQKAYYRGNSPPVLIDQNLRDIVKEADILFFSPLLPNVKVKYIKKVLDGTDSKCLKILSPQGYFRSFNDKNQVIFRKFKEAFKITYLFDFIILSDEDYPDVECISKDWVKNNDSVIIITKAEKGATFLSCTEQIDVPTKATDNTVDSTGSGDIFSACFAYKYLSCKDICTSIKFAHRIAGYCLKYVPSQIQLSNILF